MTRPPRGADALVAALGAAGARRVFALSGNHVMPVFDALFDSSIALVHTRHEAAAVHMADAWARLTGEVGIALVTGGPGHANALSALYTAQMAEAPLVLLSGHAPQRQLGRGAFQEMRQAEMALPVTKAAWTCAGPDDVARDFARALRIARAGRPGPVHLSLPSDALEGVVAGAAALTATDFAPPLQPLAEDAARALLARLCRARRPLILAGPAAMTQAGRQRLQALQAAAACPSSAWRARAASPTPAWAPLPRCWRRPTRCCCWASGWTSRCASRRCRPWRPSATGCRSTPTRPRSSAAAVPSASGCATPCRPTWGRRSMH
jgi:acetolactate synthase I/II/III large subunit